MSKPSDFCPDCSRLSAQVAALAKALWGFDYPCGPRRAYFCAGCDLDGGERAPGGEPEEHHDSECRAARAALSETALTAQAFEQRVREEEREACARIADMEAATWVEIGPDGKRRPPEYVSKPRESGARDIATLIRARNGTPETPGKES